MANTLLEVKNLIKTYDREEFFSTKKFLALDGISFCAGENTSESFSVIGSSGCGKTTLAKIIAGLIEFDFGEVKFFGKNIKSYAPREFASMTQMVFQNPYASLNPKLKIKSSFLEAFYGAQKDEAYKIIEDTLKKTGLDAGILDKYPHQFSGGQRQRIAIARSLLKKPKLIIADEPFASLDVYSQNMITDIFSDIRKNFGISIMLITHDISIAKRFAQRMIVMDGGKIVADGNYDDIAGAKENKYIYDLISAMEL
ncbi:MAG: dipeptide/oligopeptide/nickel ABC transporter ATP-binding protein [Endomicrobium sp.]|jgi:ABC-type oligopeptide transport system ATPase subunit|nr:dipeptide/oligopeptide/nickel ABC transporter ATP-binding protein [Endomicrobium sp.]